MKKILVSFILCLSIFVFLGCDTTALNEIYSNDSKIASKGDSYYAARSVSKYFNGEFTMTSTLTGSETIWRYNAPNDLAVDITYSLLLIETGKVKLVLITPNGEVSIIEEITDIITNAESKIKTLSLKKGENRIKIIAYDSARFELKAKINVGNFGND